MHILLSEAAAQQVVRLQAKHPQSAPAFVLDQVFEVWRGAEVGANAQWLQPASAFGRILAGVYDRGMTPDEWSTWSVPPADPKLQYAVALAWRSEVLAPFAARFGLILVGDPPPATPDDLCEEVKHEVQQASSPKVDAWDLYWAGELLSDLPFYRMAEVIVRRPPGAGLYDTWNLGRPATNDPAWSSTERSSSFHELPGRQHLPDGPT
ncbi:MAG: hypothetical protein IPF94_06370 [Betaproteobacteria bacterium]|nr:hypothetical protein [Betaproteobacteria bacterium]